MAPLGLKVCDPHPHYLPYELRYALVPDDSLANDCVIVFRSAFAPKYTVSFGVAAGLVGAVSESCICILFFSMNLMLISSSAPSLQSLPGG